MKLGSVQYLLDRPERTAKFAGKFAMDLFRPAQG